MWGGPNALTSYGRFFFFFGIKLCVSAASGWHLLPQRAYRHGGPRLGPVHTAPRRHVLAAPVPSLSAPAPQARHRGPPMGPPAPARRPRHRRAAPPAPSQPHSRHCAGAAVAAGVGRLVGGGRRFLHGPPLGAACTRCVARRRQGASRAALVERGGLRAGV